MQDIRFSSSGTGALIALVFGAGDGEPIYQVESFMVLVITAWKQLLNHSSHFDFEDFLADVVS